MEWCAYVLRSLGNGRLYTGSTNDLARRLTEHDRGKTRSTRHTGPYELVYHEVCADRLEARRREPYLKSGKGRQFVNDLMDKQVGD